MNFFENFIDKIRTLTGKESRADVTSFRHEEQVEVTIKDEPVEDEPYGIDKNNAHEKAIELIPEEFFWSCVDELAPYGSDEGDMALAEFRDWKKDNPNTDTFECLKWTIEGVSEKSLSEYDQSILDKNLIKTQINDHNFDDQQYIFTVDISVIATGFGQLVDDGKIDQKNKPLIQLAIDRQKLWAELSTHWDHRDDYIANLNVLERALKDA